MRNRRPAFQRRCLALFLGALVALVGGPAALAVAAPHEIATRTAVALPTFAPTRPGRAPPRAPAASGPHADPCDGLDPDADAAAATVPDPEADAGAAAVPAAGGTPARICWGSQHWVEPSYGDGTTTLFQELDFYPPAASLHGRQPAPLVVYFHEDGTTNHISRTEDAALYSTLVAAATNAGYAFASVEFRHPVVDHALPNRPPRDFRVPHWDVADAIRYLRAHAADLNVDPANFFGVGWSRGSEVLWAALQPDVVGAPSTRLNAVVAYNAQTTYVLDEYLADFVVDQPPRTWQLIRDVYTSEYPEYAQFGSAIRSIAAGAPPVMLRYEGRRRAWPLPYEEIPDPVHFPGYGDVFCDAHRASNPAGTCTLEDGVDKGHAFDHYLDFLGRFLQ